jgi:hypothetical protein
MEDRICRRPFPFPVAPWKQQKRALDARGPAFQGGRELLSSESTGERRLSKWLPSGFRMSPARFHRSRKLSDSADCSGTGRQVA